MPAIALPFYLQHGAPDLPDVPLAERRSAEPAQVNVAEAVARIEAHLAKIPMMAGAMRSSRRFISGWSVMPMRRGPTPRQPGCYGENASAFRLRRGGGGAERRHCHARAKTAFQRAITLEPGHIKSRFYLALALEQDGDKPAAIAAFGGDGQ